MNTLDLTSAKFSLPNARVLAQYARMAYNEKPTVEDTETDTQVLIRDLGNCIVVAFRGTTDLRDFITDALAWLSFVPELGASLHYGFLKAWQAIWKKLKFHLSRIGNRPVFICGHSLGGALGLIAAKYFRMFLVNVHSVYLFGCPRVGNRKFQKEYNATRMPGSPFETLGQATFTVINDCDAVARMPGWLARFRRPGRDEFISALESERIVEDPPVLWRLESDIGSLIQGCRAKHHARRMPGKPVPIAGGVLADGNALPELGELLTDHYLDNYIKALGLVKNTN